MKRLLLFITFACLLCPVFLRGEEKTVKLGVIYRELAPTSSATGFDLQGVRLAVEDLNQHGGLLGRRVELTEFYNKDTAIGSRRAALKAVEAGVIANIGPQSSSQALAAAPVFQEAATPMINTWATNPEITLVGDYIFRVCFTDTFQGKVLAEFAWKNLHAKRAVVLTCIEEKYSMDLARIFISGFRQQGGEILWEGEYLREDTDFISLLEKVKELGPDVIFLPGYHRDSGYIIKQARAMELFATFIGGDAWSTKMYLFGGDAIEGSYFSMHWDPTATDSRYREFVQRYKGKYPIYQLTSFGMAHDAVFLLADAVNRAGSLDRSMIREALESTKNFPGITGNITMDKNGDPVKPLVIARFEDGAYVSVKTVYPQRDTSLLD